MKRFFLLPLFSLIPMSSATEHTHADGTVCTGDHGSSAAAEHKPAAPAKKAHVHEDGTVCTGDHSSSAAAEHKPAAPAQQAHVHDDGTVCTSDHGSEEPMLIKLDPQARSVIALRTEPVPAAGEVISSSLYGYLSLPNYALTDYTMPVAGRIELQVKSAQEVEKGECLFSIESPEIATAILAKDELQANLERSRRDIATMSERIAKLAEAGTRKSELEEQLAFKQSEEQAITRQLAASQQALTLMCMGAEIAQKEGRYVLLIRAKQAGKVRTVGVSQGSWGERGASIVSMSDERALEITAQLYSSDQPQFSHARALIPVGNKNLVVEGSLRLAEQIDPDKQTRAVYFKPKSIPSGVQIGQLCRIDLFAPKANGEAELMSSIPDSAIIKVGLDDMVFIDHGNGIYEGKKIHAGESRHGMTPVHGLVEGQQTVIKGAYEFKFVLPSEGEKKVAGHFHADGKFHEGEEH